MVGIKHKDFFHYALTKPIVKYGLEDLWRRENLSTDIKIASNTKINHIIISFTDNYNAISIERLPSKTKVRNNS